MDDELLKFYHHKKIIEHCGYKIVIFKNTTMPNISKYIVSIFSGMKKIGEVTTDNEGNAVKKIKARIDKSEERGGRLVFMNQ